MRRRAPGAADAGRLPVVRWLLFAERSPERLGSNRMDDLT
jgi:hypothetical protein